MFESVGFIKRDGEIISHRTRLKILLNPVLRVFGYEIVSIIDIEKGEFIRYSIRNHQEQ